MNRATNLIKNELLRTEKNVFIFLLLIALVGYAATTVWLDAIRQTASTWLLWSLIGLQFVLFLSIFAVCAVRMSQCRKSRWWLWAPLLLSRISNWDLVAIPATAVVALAISERSRFVSRHREHLVPPDQEEDQEIKKARTEIHRLRRDLDLLENPETLCSFGQMAFDGDGVEQDYAQAAAWYKIAAEQGSARAQHSLALMYEEGLGVPRDPALAAKYYRMAAAQGYPGSMNNLGALHETGEGVPKDRAAAIDLYRQAAHAGDPNAISNLQRLDPAGRSKPIPTQQKYIEATVTVASNLYLETTPGGEAAPAQLCFTYPDSRYRYMLFCLSTVITSALAYDEKHQLEPLTLAQGCLEFVRRTAEQNPQEYFGRAASLQHDPVRASLLLKDFLKDWSQWPALEKQAKNDKIIDLISSIIHATESSEPISAADRERLAPLALYVDCHLPAMAAALLQSAP